MLAMLLIIMPATILTLNSGSSSLKLGLYRAEQGGEPELLFRGAADAIGKPGGSLIIANAEGKPLYREDAAHESQPDAFAHAAEKLRELNGAEPTALGYRIVHGGPHLTAHCRIIPQVLETLRQSAHYAPLHIPPALELIETAGRLYPTATPFACFDTAFHTTMPPAATTYAIPVRFREQGVRRYGFHGLSYESIVASLAPQVPPRLIVAHLGNGASLCAIADGRSVDTSMGLTPTGGIPMGTRTGDLDPGVVLFLVRSEPQDLDKLELLLNHECGLAALSSSGDAKGSPDMRELTRQAEAGSAAAELAIEIFCRDIAKTVAAYAAILGGLDTLVFTGGIGEHSAPVRERVCRQLSLLGIRIDTQANGRHDPIVSATASTAKVCVLPADEDGRIARHVQQLLLATRAPAQPASS